MNPIKSARMTIQKNLARNNSGSRNNRPCPNPNIMEILSFSKFTFLIVAIMPWSLKQYPFVLPEALCDITTTLVYSLNDTIYRFTHYNTAICRYIPYTTYRFVSCRSGAANTITSGLYDDIAQSVPNCSTESP